MTTMTHHLTDSRADSRRARTAGPVRRATDRARRSHLSAGAVVVLGLLGGFLAAPYLLG
ncbi:hypothetical protein [Cellulosimicrobium arenosum]|uniref:Uncharacterized protein n=1 Tax=Cellulosimicrobium arenosum TaxID=2708133 RepID=A0A927PF89_9MICO|nr:hypothetical protein [Cellulosimicrobium arenosum]MBD8079685.1 hypothetical protein [Cellulosimicrobium arenosum]